MLKRLHTTWFIIIAAMLFSILSTAIPFIQKNVMLLAVILLAIFALASKLSHSREHFWISTILFIIFLSSYLLLVTFNKNYDPEKLSQSLIALRIASTMAFLFLSFTFLIGPISRIRKKFSFYKYRRAFGVTTFLLAGFHFFNVVNLYYQRDIGKAFASPYNYFILFGFTTYIILLFMALTSWDAIQKHISSRKFKIFHALVLLSYLLYLGWFYSIHGSFLGKGWIISLFVIFWIAAAPWSPLTIKTQERVDPWRQLHFLIWIAYISIVFHISFIINEFKQFYNILPAQIAFYAIVIIVIGTHTMGSVMRINEELKLRKRYKSLSPPLQEKNETYYPAIKAEEFKQNEGKKVYITPLKRYLAIHKLNDKFYAFSAYCAHQKGPIDKGRIAGQYVVCPWHGWAFSLKDGCAAPGYQDAIPAYTTLVKNNIVYVKEKPIKSIEKF